MAIAGNMINENRSFIGLALKLSTANQALLDFLVQDQDDLKLFMESYFTKGNEFFSLMDFRTYKQSVNQMSEAEFVAAYKESPRKALEKLFQQKVEADELHMLKVKILAGDISLMGLYNDHKRKPDHMLKYFIMQGRRI